MVTSKLCSTMYGVSFYHLRTVFYNYLWWWTLQVQLSLVTYSASTLAAGHGTVQ